MLQTTSDSLSVALAGCMVYRKAAADGPVLMRGVPILLLLTLPLLQNCLREVM